MAADKKDKEEKKEKKAPAGDEKDVAEKDAAVEDKAAATEEKDAAAEKKAKVSEKKAKPAKKAAPGKEAKPKKKKKAVKPKAEVKVPAVKALSSQQLKLNPEVFAVEPKTGVLHEVVRAEFASMRQGSASTKTRGEVRGGGAKPWRQKGTGRARAGSNRMPHWTGGGVTFGPSPRDYSFKVNRKVKRKALKMALSARVSEGGFKVVDGLPFEEPKTAAAEAVLADLDVAYPLLVLLSGEEANAALAFRNLPRVGVRRAQNVMVSDIIGARTVLATKDAVEQLNRLGESK
ncbi:MAG: 50S ribosomal protein L4 [Actinomycetota bacterium]